MTSLSKAFAAYREQIKGPLGRLPDLAIEEVITLLQLVPIKGKRLTRNPTY